MRICSRTTFEDHGWRPPFGVLLFGRCDSQVNARLEKEVSSDSPIFVKDVIHRNRRDKRADGSAAGDFCSNPWMYLPGHWQAEGPLWDSLPHFVSGGVTHGATSLVFLGREPLKVLSQ
jgi:hypothetical protein